LEKIGFKECSFICYGNQSYQWIGFVLSVLEEDLIRNIPMKLY